jgi:glycerol-3-phosphate dehydrogenase
MVNDAPRQSAVPEGEAMTGATGAAPQRVRAADLGGGEFDVLVIGGGINGAGIARDAALRGLTVAVVEQGDFASGTSSRSSKLIHGGIRYLQMGHVRLVLESSRERERLRRLAPNLVQPQRFVYPVYRGSPVPRWQLKLGLLGYDLLAGWWSVERHRMLSAAEVPTWEPGLRTDGLRGAGVYFDARTDDARLVVETMLSAAAEGAQVASYVKVAALLKVDGQVVGARVQDLLTGDQVDVRARVVVNATGPWVDQILALDQPGQPARLRLTKGAHILVPRDRLPHRDAIVLHAVRDQRVMFVIPWGTHSLIGTTDTDHHGGPDTPPVVEAEDVDYLLGTVNHYFPDVRLLPADVASGFAGLRPLVAPPMAAGLSPSATSREEEILVSASGLVSIAGGKLTTYRIIAGHVVDRVVTRLRARGVTRAIGPSSTADRPLPGGSGIPDVLAAQAVSNDGHGLGAAVVQHLAQRYGDRMRGVLGMIGADRALGGPIVPSLPDPRAEVVAAVDREWAQTLEDVLRRRTQVALCDADSGAGVAAEVAALMAPRLGWTEEQTRVAAATYVQVVREAQARWR